MKQQDRLLGEDRIREIVDREYNTFPRIWTLVEDAVKEAIKAQDIKTLQHLIGKGVECEPSGDSGLSLPAPYWYAQFPPGLVEALGITKHGWLVFIEKE